VLSAPPSRPDGAVGPTAEEESPERQILPSEREPVDSPPRRPRDGAIVSAFDQIAPVYDRLNRILSFGRDGRWRRAVVEASDLGPGDAVIDVAAGTGKLAAALADRVGPFGRVLAVDLSPGMVARGAAATSDLVQCEFVLGDAAELPSDDGRFDAATIAFGLRVLRDRAAAMRELRRVVRPGGHVVCLEPTTPRPGWWGRTYGATVHRLAPLAGTASGRRDAYSRLNALGATPPDADELIELMASSGLVEIRHRGLWLGAVSLCVGTVPARA
jgi:demethylmenaquinone methyltransferase / 2-methoxy-6-polyprenyl-1,4-benzoquinol methylase